MKLLEKASLVVYAGSLVNPALLDYCPAGCETLNSASMTLEQVIAAMSARPRDETVVRLHTGDPSIYGSFSYLQRLLLADGYPVETVPGVPSFSAAAARLNLPLVEGDEPLHVAPGAHDMGETLRLPGTCVLMKASGPLGETKARLKSSGKEVFAVENCGMDTEKLYRGVDQVPDSAGYLSLIVAKDPPDRP